MRDVGGGRGGEVFDETASSYLDEEEGKEEEGKEKER